MDATEGFGGRGDLAADSRGGSTRGKGAADCESRFDKRATGSRTATVDEHQALQALLEQVRESIDATMDRSATPFTGPRAEMVLNRVLARVQRDRLRGAWFTRTVRAVTTTAAALWNSRAIRMLVP